MPKVNQQPDPNRRQTRATNANAHPGRIAIEALAVWRNKDAIEDDKRARNEKHQAREAKKANKETSVIEIADFENEMAREDRDEEIKFPRRKKAEDLQPSKKRKGQPKNGSNSHRRRIAASIQITSADNEGDTDTELTDDDRPQAKKSKTSSGSQALRRTETYFRDEFSAAARNDTQELTENGLSITFPQTESPMMVIGDDNNNVPMREGVTAEFEGSQDDVGSDENDFETPRALKKRAFMVSGGPATRKESAGSESEEELDDTPKKRSIDAHETGPIKSIDPMKVTGATTQRKDRRQLGSATRKESVGPESEEVDDNPKRSINAHEKEPIKSIDLTKVIGATAQRKDRRAFRKEVELRREFIVKDKIRDGSESIRDRDQATTSQLARPGMPGVGSDESERFSKRTAPSANGHKAVTHSKPYSKNNTRLNIDSRTSATTGNRIGITHPTHAELGKGTSSQTKPNSTTVKTTDSFSDEDDSAERATILQSPPKGMQRLSSQAIVKIEQPSRSDERKSRSKKQILDQDILLDWSRYVEPHFVYWFFYKLNPWPTSRAVETCAQKLWDWTFGDSYPLNLSKSPKHIQLLTQKLCDIRTQCAASAFISLDAEFQLASDNGHLKDLEQIKDLRRQYAQGLYDNTKFIFGKYSVTDDGIVRRSQPYRGKLILRTVAFALKYVKDVKRNDGVPLPSSHYPKTLLAIAAAVVERALKITIDDKYDFETGKLIPQPDPSHPAKKTTSMFAFSEMAWLPKIETHLDKSLPKLKETDWKKIMEEVAQFMNATTSKLGKSSKGKGRAMPEDDDELELSWDSDSDSD